MKRFHVHLNVIDLDTSIRFYNQLFAAGPSVRKHDYAKWLLEDPRLNFAISTYGETRGVSHLGLQVDENDELAAIGERLDAAGASLVPQDAAICCYARSGKLWTEDPQGVRWESFHTLGEATTYHDAGDAACMIGAGNCTPDPRAMKAGAEVPAGRNCCAPASACC